MHADPSLVCRAFAAGAQGYLLKTVESSELFFALREVLRGRRYVTPAVAGDLVDAAVGNETVDFFTQLTSRQREVLQLVAEGKTLKEIARTLHLSVKTVEYHKTRLMKQLGLHTTAELARFAAARGLVS